MTCFFVAFLHEDREFAYIHEHNWNEQMWNIAGRVDFQSLVEERLLDRPFSSAFDHHISQSRTYFEAKDPKGPMVSFRDQHTAQYILDIFRLYHIIQYRNPY